MGMFSRGARIRVFSGIVGFVFAAGAVNAATSVPGIVSASKISGGSWVATDGTFTVATPLSNIANYAANQPRVWKEKTIFAPNISYAGVPAGGVRVDWLGGTDAYATNYALAAGGTPAATATNTTRVLPQGTYVTSYYLYSQRTGGGATTSFVGELIFSSPIVGVVLQNDNSFGSRLDATNTVFGKGGVTGYPNGNSIGFDAVAVDRFRVENLGDGTYKFHFELNGNGNDNIRLLTLTATPEPAAWAGFAMAALAIAGISRRRKHGRN